MREGGIQSWLRLCPMEDSDVSTVKYLGLTPEPTLIITPPLCLSSDMEASTRQTND
jgi:hypothetical protein